MISSCFVKFSYCSGVFKGCINSGILHRNAVKYHHYRTNVSLKNVVRPFDGRSCPRSLYSTVLPGAHAERNDVQASFVLLMDQDTEASSDQLRNLLYCESKDEVITKLKSCSSNDEVYNIINQFEHPNPEYLVQSLLVLRDLQKSDSLYHSVIDTHMKENSSFNKLVEQIITSVPQLNIDELSSCILYLHFYDLDSETMLSLISTYENKIKEMDSSSISALSLAQVCMVVETFENLWASYTLLSFLPLLREKLDTCNDYEDFRRITLCLQKMRKILSSSIIKPYADKCSFLMQKNEDTTSEINRLRAILRCIHFLNSKQWKVDYSKFINDMLLTMQGRIHLLPVRLISLLHSTVFGLQEPRQILHELKSLVKLKFSEGTAREQLSVGAALDLRTAFLFYTSPGEKNDRRSECIYSLEKYLDTVVLSNDFQYEYVYSFINVLHNVHKHDHQLANKYWNNLIKSMSEKNSIQRPRSVIDICRKYIGYNFLYNYTNSTFEACVYSRLREIAEENIVFGAVDKCLVDVLSLYFNFDLERFEKVCVYYMTNASRFEPLDAAFMSFVVRGIRVRLSKSKKLSSFLHFYVKLLSAFNNAAIEHLKNKKDGKIYPTIQLFRIYSYSEGLKDTELYKLIIKSLNEVPIENLSSKKILSMMPTSFISQLFEPSLVDKMVKFFLNRKDVVTSYSIIQFLKYLYSFGYTPERCDEFIDFASQTIIREKDELSAFHLMYAALSLCYFNHFPRQLSDYIFNLKFLDYINTETSLMCRKKSRVFHLNFLELNRAACLEFPSTDLPWFHENYCKAKLSLESRYSPRLHKELLQALKRLINDDEALQVNCHSPYYHTIDFVLHTNKNGEPVDPSKCSPQDLRKIAILLNRKSSSSYYTGKGKMDMTIRQLEILNYKVAVIDGHLWDSMHMTEPTAKENYLCNAIWSR